MATDDQIVNYLAGDDDGVGLDAHERHELDAITSLLADPTLWDDPPASLGAQVVSAIAAERGTAATSPAALPAPVGPAAAQPLAAPAPAVGGTVSPISSA